MSSDCRESVQWLGPVLHITAIRHQSKDSWLSVLHQHPTHTSCKLGARSGTNDTQVLHDDWLLPCPYRTIDTQRSSRCHAPDSSNLRSVLKLMSFCMCNLAICGRCGNSGPAACATCAANFIVHMIRQVRMLIQQAHVLMHLRMWLGWFASVIQAETILPRCLQWFMLTSKRQGSSVRTCIRMNTRVL